MLPPPLHPGLWFVCFLPSLCQGSTTTCWSPLLRLSSFCGLDTLFSTASLLNFFSPSFCCLLWYVCPDCLQKLVGSLFVMQDFSSSPLLTSQLASWRLLGDPQSRNCYLLIPSALLLMTNCASKAFSSTEPQFFFTCLFNNCHAEPSHLSACFHCTAPTTHELLSSGESHSWESWYSTSPVLAVWQPAELHP